MPAFACLRFASEPRLEETQNSGTDSSKDFLLKRGIKVRKSNSKRIRKAHMTAKTFLLGALVVATGLEHTQTFAAGLTLKYSAQPQPVTVTVSGTVRDKDSGNLISNALVRAHIVVHKYQGAEHFAKCPYQETVTDGDGRYRIVFVTPLTVSGPMQGRDTLCVDAGARGYETQPQYARANVTSANRGFTNFNFALSAGKLFQGVVVTPGGQPASGASVRVQNSFNGDWNFFGSLGRTVTGEDGSFQFWVRPGGDYLERPWLCVVQPGVGSLLVWDPLAKEEPGTLTLNPGGEIAGRVVDVKGAPIANCEISVWGFPCDLMNKTVTDNEGKYVLKGIPGESTLRAFLMKKNGFYTPELAQVEVYARPNPGINLKDAPHFAVIVQDGQTVSGPELVVGADTSVAGVLLASRTALSLGGLLVRLDESWENMVEVDVSGRFWFPYVPAGKHTLTAYLPHNLRYDRGIGQTRIEVQQGQPLKDVQIQLADLAELRVQYLDASGNPLPGISAAATWSRNGDGGWTEGTVSDNEGWAVLYLYPDSVQYLRGFDRGRKLTAETIKELKPEPGQVMESLQVVMVPTASLSGRLVDAQGQALAAKSVLCTLNLADGTAREQKVKTAADGRFRMEGITPGILKLRLETDGILFQDPLGKAVEVQPGTQAELGDIVLQDGLDMAKLIKEKQAQALTQPQELTQSAQDFFNKIRTADYDRFLKEGANWREFPIVGYYQTYKWFDVLVPWICRTFKTNPIVKVELGRVFANPEPVNRQKGLPTVPYKLTLKDGSTLEGSLPFQYDFESGTGYWFALQGIDWHLRSESRE